MFREYIICKFLRFDMNDRTILCLETPCNEAICGLNLSDKYCDEILAKLKEIPIDGSETIETKKLWDYSNAFEEICTNNQCREEDIDYFDCLVSIEINGKGEDLLKELFGTIVTIASKPHRFRSAIDENDWIQITQFSFVLCVFAGPTEENRKSMKEAIFHRLNDRKTFLPSLKAGLVSATSFQMSLSDVLFALRDLNIKSVRVFGYGNKLPVSSSVYFALQHATEELQEERDYHCNVFDISCNFESEFLVCLPRNFR